MKNIILRISLAAVASIASSACSRFTEDAAENPHPSADNAEPGMFVPGEIYVKFTPEFIDTVEKDLSEGYALTRAGVLTGAFTRAGASSLERLFPDAGEYEPRTRREGLHRWYKITIDRSQPPTKASDMFSSIPGVEYASPVRKVQSRASVFDDAKLPLQWQYVNDGTLSPNHVQGCDINVEKVWRKYTTGNPDVIVSVVDGGIDYKHEDLTFNYVGGYNYVTNTGKVTAHDHGTHVAGTIAATNNNGIGVCGVAGGDYKAGKKGVGLFSSQVFDNEHGSGDFPRAIKESADKGALISQNSWGYVYDTYEEAKADRPEKALSEAIDYFVKYAGCDNAGNQKMGSPMKGGIVIFSAGNDNWDVEPICQYCNVLAVGALGPDFTRSYFSNYGDWVDISAPGGDVVNTNGAILSTKPDNGYGYMQGTSMACPHVSGVAALVVSKCGGKGFTPQKLREKLIGGANSSYKGCASNHVGPLVDALAAIEYGIKPKAVSQYSVAACANSIDFSFALTASSDGIPAYGYLLLASRTKESLTGITDFDNLPSDVFYARTIITDKEPGDEVSGRISSLEFNTPYYVALVGYGRGNNYSPISEIKQVTTRVNTPPVIHTDYAGDYVVKAHQTLVIPFIVEDSDGHKLDVQFETDYPSEGGQCVTFSRATQPSGYNLTLAGPLSTPGTYTFTIRADDGWAQPARFSHNYTFIPNQGPVKVKDIDNVLLENVSDNATLDFGQCIQDPDGEPLTYGCKVDDPTVVHINRVEGTVFKITALASGFATVTVTGTDAGGLSASGSFRVFVSDPGHPVFLPSVLDKEAAELPVVISSIERVPVHIKLSSSTGQVVFDGKIEADVFNPAMIPVEGIFPGIYHVLVNYSDVSFVGQFVKL